MFTGLVQRIGTVKRVSFRGFRGKYRVRGTDAGGRSVEKEFQVK